MFLDHKGGLFLAKKLKNRWNFKLFIGSTYCDCKNIFKKLFWK